MKPIPPMIEFIIILTLLGLLVLTDGGPHEIDRSEREDGNASVD